MKMNSPTTKIVLLSLVALQATAMETAMTGAPAINMLDIDQVSEVAPPKGIKTVTHKKEPNRGYQKGSPLYNKQEGIEDPKSGTKAKKTTAAHDAAAKTGKEDWTGLAAAMGLSGAWVKSPVPQPTFYDKLMGISVYAVFVLAFAYLYRKRMVQPLGSRAKGDSPVTFLPAWTRCGFAYSLCDCGNISEDWPICLTAYFCPIIQWASTASKSDQSVGYWKAVAFLLIAVIVAPFSYGLSWLVVAIAFYKRRRDLRKTYNHLHPESRSMWEDILLVFCSPLTCCQLVQEAREVQYTMPKQQTA